MQLNPEQALAVKYIDGALLVLAGAGSGKTRVITQKIVYLVKECGYKANGVVAVTFTNKAAREMKERVGQVLPKPLRRGLTVSTFHHLGLTIIKKAPALFSLKKNFSIFDSSDSLSLMQQLLNRHQARDKDFLFGIQSCISDWKNNALLPADISTLTFNSPIQNTAKKLYSDYEKHLNTYNALDFDDLILKPLLAFKQNVDFLDAWQNKVRYLLVDEYQDTNASQYQLVKLLVGARAHLTVVGDDSQSVYAWRGARPENLGQLEKDYPTLKVIKLEQNYRSSGCILKASNHLISHNAQLYKKHLWSELGFGDLIRVLYCKDEFDEAEQVGSEIVSHKLRYKSDFSHYALLYRGNHQARLFEKVFRTLGIPYRLSGGQSFFAKKEIKDIFSYMRLLCNENDDNAFLRIVNTPKRGIGKNTVEILARYAASRGISLFSASKEFGLSEQLSLNAYKKLSDFCERLSVWAEKCRHPDEVKNSLLGMIEQIGYEAYLYDVYDEPSLAQRRMDNIRDLVDWVHNLMFKNKEAPLGLDDMIAKLILLDVMDRDDESTKDEVQLMTLHASKGLEFPFVYMVGMEEDLLPHKTSIEEDNIEEERRLAYVGITRAQRELTFTLAKKRRRYGELCECKPSRFLDELPEDTLTHQGKQGSTRTEAKGVLHIKDLKALLS